ncbi:MAG TPA: class I adenylate-forming enzyme family protein [Micropepsaceae bacterium]|nr:class I adenylate-forming enzyme family protein [Micropepsaceae bacterium]
MDAAAPVVSFADLIFHHALSRPEKPAIILTDRVATYGMMAQGILRAQARLRGLGLPPGALVCLSLDNPIRQMIVGAALFRLGHPVLLASHPDQAVPLRLAVAAFLHGSGISLIPGQRHVVIDDAWFAGETKGTPTSPPQGFASESDICCVALSSGTTGRPKAISLTIKAFQQWVMNYYSTLGYGSWERLLMLVGLSSSWGFTLAAHALFAGRTLVFAANPRESLHMTGVYGADAMVASSAQLRELVTEQTRAPVPCPSLHTILTGGGLLSLSLIAEARAKLCSGIVILYGSTEAGGTAFATTDRLSAIEGSIGFAAPWAEVEIVDDDHRTLPPGTDGSIRIRATCQGAPYPPGADNPSFRGGWFYPGDRGRIDADNMIVLAGRTSGVINAGGLKLAPEAIEDILCKHPAVNEAAAFGTFGAAGIEEIMIVVAANRPVADSTLIDWCAERGIPVARITFIESLPKTASGKIDRDLLRQQLGVA